MPRGRKKKVEEINDIIEYSGEEGAEFDEKEIENEEILEENFDKNLYTDDDEDIKAKEIKETNILTSKYEKEFTDEESKSALSLKTAFSEFLVEEKGIEDATENTTTIPTGIDVADTILGGGIGMKIGMLVGLPGCGKTAYALKVVSTGQKKFRDKFISVYLDSEESINQERFKQLGVNPSTVLHTDLTVEKVFKIIEGLCAFKKNNNIIDTPSLVVWDSIATTQPEGADEVEAPAKIMGLKAALLSFYLPKYSRKMSKYNISLLTINHLRDKLDIGPVKTANDIRGTGNYTIPGGKQLKYLAFQTIMMKPIDDITGEYGFNGLKVKVKALKNKLFTPLVETDLILSFQYGFSNFWTNYQLLKDCKKITGSSYFSLNGYNEKKFRQSQALELYKKDNKFKTIFEEEVKSTLKSEYIDKYKNVNIKSEDIIG